MKMKSKRRIERDRARRDARTRVRESEPRQDGSALDIADLDPAIARALMGYDE
jgi:hypothetical protein